MSLDTLHTQSYQEVVFKLLHVILQVYIASSDAELQKVFCYAEYEAVLLETGFSKPVSRLKLSDREVIRGSLLDYHCLVKVKAQMDQFGEGVEQAGVGKFLKTHSEALKPMFVANNNQLTQGIEYSHGT